MGEAAVQMESDESRGGAERARPRIARARLRTCVGCGEHVDTLVEGDLIRLILSPDGQVAVDSRGGTFGRGAHVHARRDCVERAATAGLLKATKGKAHLVTYEMHEGEAAERAPLTGEALARAIAWSLDRRVEGLIATVVRSRRIACGADAVTGACRRGDADLVVVACDAAAAADLTEVRRAVAEGRAVAWGTKRRLSALVRVGGAEVGVVAIASRTVGAAIGSAVRAAHAVAAAPPVGKPGGRIERAPKRPKLGATQQGAGFAPKPPLEAD